MKWIKIPNTNEEIAENLETHLGGEILTSLNWYEANKYCKAKNCRLPTFAETELVKISENYEWTSDSSLEYPQSKIVHRGCGQKSYRLRVGPTYRFLIGFRCVRKGELKNEMD